MKKKIPIIIFFVIVGGLILGFIIKTAVDGVYYANYGHLGSAPFYAYLLVNVLCFLVPAAVIFIVGVVVYRCKTKRK